ncbi:hypothetical protein B0H10DRAFT_258225 [Mycena sp. CBHHK59/15]|nr:hypothetical protein B0H10DRAFT_258225 [Mycena sp. CBHHK59/15]
MPPGPEVHICRRGDFRGGEHHTERCSGRPVKGRVTVHSTGGSTTMSDISVSYQTVYREHWAEEQAATGGDDAFSNFTSSTCVYSGGQQALSPVSIAFSSVFETDAYLKGRVQRLHPSRSQVNGPLTAAKPYFDFELDVAEDMPIDFPSYYGTGETILQLTLTALYSHDVAKCMGAVDELAYDAEDETALDDAAGTEEGLWTHGPPSASPASRSGSGAAAYPSAPRCPSRLWATRRRPRARSSTTQAWCRVAGHCRADGAGS